MSYYKRRKFDWAELLARSLIVSVILLCLSCTAMLMQNLVLTPNPASVTCLK